MKMKKSDIYISKKGLLKLFSNESDNKTCKKSLFYTTDFVSDYVVQLSNKDGIISSNSYYNIDKAIAGYNDIKL